MFPSNLHKNIAQLDRQISLLENECKNMEVENRKKGFKAEPPYSKCSKISCVQLKPSPIKVTLKNTDCSKKSKKLTPFSGRLQSTSSLQSHFSKAWSDNCETVVGKKTKVSKLNSNIPVCLCQKLSGVNSNLKKKKKCLSCDFCNEDSALDLPKDEKTEDHKNEHLLHKELLYSNSANSMKVTLTQKPNTGKEISPIRKIINSEEKFVEDGDNCKCQSKEQKWSEILCADSFKKKAVNGENSPKNKCSEAENKTVNQPFSINNNRGLGVNESQENINNKINNISIQEENFEVPVKFSSPSYVIKKQPQLNASKLEKEIQCTLGNTYDKEFTKESIDFLKIIQSVVNQLKQMPISDLKHLPEDLETTFNKTLLKEPLKESSSETKQSFSWGVTTQNNTFMDVVKQHCENLIKDKELLSKELVTKNTIIATMNKREEEYLSLIKSLKLNLEKAKESAQDGVEAIKEMNILKIKFVDKMKLLDSVKKHYNKSLEVMEQYILENQKLRTQLKICTLEAQKQEVLLAGKEAEISKYKEEIQNFQRQISDHLATLKSNAQGIDLEKMMEAIFQQSQVFLQTELDTAVIAVDQKDTSKLQNVLMHSSPTSTKTSVVNSSWKRISSIHDHDQSKAGSILNLNEDSNAKNYFQIFGNGLSAETKVSKKSNEMLVENQLDKNEVKRSLSFTSCMSINDDQSSESGSSRIEDSLTTKDETFSNEGKTETELEKSNRVSFEKAQSNIDEVLRNMKLKFSKKIFETSLANCTTDDFVDSQISSISQ